MQFSNYTFFEADLIQMISMAFNTLL